MHELGILAAKQLARFNQKQMDRTVGDVGVDNRISCSPYPKKIMFLRITRIWLVFFNSKAADEDK
jgi:hypothetical protein